MNRTVERVEFTKQTVPKPIRVAAYARVSSDKDAMHHSMSAQISYFSSLIQSHSGWQYVGVYADEAKTGTKDTRENFVRLLADCRAGKIDLIITKSVSRFARNTVTLLETVRELKDLGIDVFFEEQNIHTASGDGELMLSILASFAQAESQSVSENQKWRIKKNFEEGKPWNVTMLGYRYANGKFTIVPEEAETVKRIFLEYLSGKGYTAIMKGLNDDGIPTKRGNPWIPGAVAKVLRNSTYTGNLLLQKTYREDCITKRTVINNGELPQYLAEKSHEAIIPQKTFDAVQCEMENRAKKHARCKQKLVYPFTGLLICGICGKHYHRKVTATGAVWICPTYNTYGKNECASKQIPEAALLEMTAEIGIDRIISATVDKDNTVIFHMADGSQVIRQWKDRSRAESWTQEMKDAARERKKQNG